MNPLKTKMLVTRVLVLLWRPTSLTNPSLDTRRSCLSDPDPYCMYPLRIF